MENNKIKIIFIGTPEFGAIVLEGLVKNDFKPALVVTETDKPVGRKKIITPPLVKVTALRYDIPIAQPERIENLKAEIENLKPDLAIVAAYGQIIPKDILSIPKHGFLNVHPSLLPKYRGPSPVQYAILNGDKETGATIMLMAEKLDHGPILANGRLPIDSQITYRELHNKLAELGAEILLQTIPGWISGKIKPLPQDETKATYTKILEREDGKIDWKKSAEEIERQIKAFLPWPGSFAECENNKFGIKTIKIWKAGTQEQTEAGSSGTHGKTYLAANGQIAVQTGKNFLIIEELQPESGKRMKSAEFLKGHPDFIGISLK